MTKNSALIVMDMQNGPIESSTFIWLKSLSSVIFNGYNGAYNNAALNVIDSFSIMLIAIAISMILNESITFKAALLYAPLYPLNITEDKDLSHMNVLLSMGPFCISITINALFFVILSTPLIQTSLL